MAEKRKGHSEESLGSLVDRKLSDSIGYYSSKLAKERENVLKYYNGELPVKQKESSSSYISTEVYDAVESMKAQLLETFSAGREILKFDPLGPEDAEAARIATAYCDNVVFSQNPGYHIFGEVIHDGLTARAGVAKVYWEEGFADTEEEFDGLPEEAVGMLAASDEIPALDATQDPLTGTYKGKLTKRADKSQVRIEVINPEEFVIDQTAKAINPDTFCAHRTFKSLDELVAMGFDRAKIEEAGSAEARVTVFHNETEKMTRSQIDGGYSATDTEGRDLYEVNECYIKVRMKGDEHAKLYKVLRLGKTTLDQQEVDTIPFVAFVPLPIPHTFYGNNFANRVIPAQNIRTVLTRAIVDHAAITVNPRYTVLKGGLTNPRELLDNRLGGLVNVTRPDAVNPLEQAPLNPFVFQTLELIKAQNEETTGISSLSQGLNKDAISKQNSDAMVERLVSLSQTRQKIIARNFASFLVELYLKVYDLVIAKEDKNKVVEVAGNWVEINPASWSERRAATVSLHLGYKEYENEAQKLMMLSSAMVQHPLVGRMVTPDNAYNLGVDVMKLYGFGNYTNYITDPKMLPPPEPDNSLEMMKLQIEMKKAEAALLNAQANMKKVDMHGAIEVSREQLQEKQQQFDNMIAERDMHRRDVDIANKIDVAQREVTIAESNPVTETTAVVSPR